MAGVSNQLSPVTTLEQGESSGLLDKGKKRALYNPQEEAYNKRAKLDLAKKDPIYVTMDGSDDSDNNDQNLTTYVAKDDSDDYDSDDSVLSEDTNKNQDVLSNRQVSFVTKNDFDGQD